MIIPKAMFLTKSYQKQQADLQRRLKNERTLLMGRIVNSLRSPDNHKLGMISYFFNAEEFPLLTQNEASKAFSEIQHELSTAGYYVSINRGPSGIVICLDWRVRPD
jgi:hypothetical protein